MMAKYTHGDITVKGQWDLEIPYQEQAPTKQSLSRNKTNSVGEHYTIALKEDGTVYVSGLSSILVSPFSFTHLIIYFGCIISPLCKHQRDNAFALQSYMMCPENIRKPNITKFIVIAHDTILYHLFFLFFLWNLDFFWYISVNASNTP